MSATPKKAAPKAKKPAVPASHPPFSAMIRKAIKELKEKGGSSRSAILKYILANFKVGNDAVRVNSHVRLALRRELKAGNLLQPKGPSGKIRLSEKAKAAKPAADKKPRAKKTPTKKAAKQGRGPSGKIRLSEKAKAAKPAAAKKPRAKKTPTKKAATPKKPRAKTAKKASPKKAAAKKSPKKAVKKPAVKKSPKKVKKSPKKPAAKVVAKA